MLDLYIQSIIDALNTNTAFSSKYLASVYMDTFIIMEAKIADESIIAVEGELFHQLTETIKGKNVIDSKYFTYFESTENDTNVYNSVEEI